MKSKLETLLGRKPTDAEKWAYRKDQGKSAPKTPPVIFTLPEIFYILNQ